MSRLALSSTSLSTPRRPRLSARTGVRVFAALHIYFFRLKQAHNAGLLRFDVLGFGMLTFLAFAGKIPYVLLRHGLLAPFTLLAIAELARGRGLISRVFSWRAFGRLSEASFSLFALRMPAGLWFCVAMLRSPTGTTVQFVGLVTWTLGLAVLCAEAVQRPLSTGFVELRRLN